MRPRAGAYPLPDEMEGAVRVATTVDEQRSPAVLTEEELEKQRRRRDRVNRWFWRILGYVVVLGLWEWASGTVMSEQLLPSPSHVIETFGEIWGTGKVLSSFQATLTRIAWGFGLAFIIGTAIGLLSQNRWWESFFKDAVVIGITAPGLIWALITAIIWGSRPYGPVIAVILTTFALVTVNVSEGVKSLPKDLMDMGKAFRVSQLSRQRHIVLPHLAPFLFTAVRFGFSIAWKVTVLTEIFSSSEGVGFEMRVSSQLFRIDEFLTWILAFFVFALVLEKVVLQYFERRYFRWRQEVAT